MPHSGEFANKCSHVDLLKNPDVSAFMKECAYLREPSAENLEEIKASFEVIPFDHVETPRYLFSWDGSRYEAAPDPGKLPNTRCGFVKVAGVLIDLEKMHDVYDDEFGMVDPFAVAQSTGGNKEILHFVLPGSNLRYKNAETVADGFRLAFHEWLQNDRYAIELNGERHALSSTFKLLAMMRPGGAGAGVVNVHKCPACEDKGNDGAGHNVPLDTDYKCRSCGVSIYPTDSLRIHEAISDTNSNEEALNRLMSVIEHLLLVHYLRFFQVNSPNILSNTAFFLDGPLAVFGQPAWLHRCIMAYLDDLRLSLNEQGNQFPVIVGVQKSGQINDYLGLVRKHIQSGTVRVIDDEYRYKYVVGGRQPANQTFGFETYYGQDFAFKTPTGHAIVFNLPYPFREKGDVSAFKVAKADVALYPELPKALKLISSLETVLYEDALLPAVLAHKYTAFNLEPGGRVLDMLTKEVLS